MASASGSPARPHTATVLQAYDIGLDVLADLVNAGLITMDDQITSGQRPSKVTRVRITEAGRAALGQ